PTMQSEVVATIAKQVEVKLTPDEQTRLRKTQHVDPEAHAAYLKGRYYWHQFFTEVGMNAAIEHSRRAIELEPGYAHAWALLSACFLAMAVQSMLPPSEAAPAAKKASVRAQALDPSAVLSHTVDAAIHLFIDWDWPAAERAIKRAIEISPSCEAHSLFAHY